MKRIISIALLALAFHKNLQSAAVTYEFNGGRFGDQLVTYLHARWIAYKYNIPFIYKPFDNAEKLKINSLYKPENIRNLKPVTFNKYGSKTNLDHYINPQSNNLYVIPFFPESHEERVRLGFNYFEIDWSDQAFRNLIKYELSPIVNLQRMNLPTDRLTVAVHMRKGGGFKNDKLLQESSVRNPKIVYADEVTPLRFVPIEFYIEHIIKLSELLDNKPLYVHIFTDDKNPASLVEKCKKAVNKPNIVFGSREQDNRHDANVLDDFFALTQFDCLIRAESNFSLVASKLADYLIEITPKRYRWQGTKLIITESEIKMKK